MVVIVLLMLLGRGFLYSRTWPAAGTSESSLEFVITPSVLIVMAPNRRASNSILHSRWKRSTELNTSPSAIDQSLFVRFQLHTRRNIAGPGLVVVATLEFSTGSSGLILRPVAEAY